MQSSPASRHEEDLYAAKVERIYQKLHRHRAVRLPWLRGLAQMDYNRWLLVSYPCVMLVGAVLMMAVCAVFVDSGLHSVKMALTATLIGALMGFLVIMFQGLLLKTRIEIWSGVPASARDVNHVMRCVSKKPRLQEVLIAWMHQCGADMITDHELEILEGAHDKLDRLEKTESDRLEGLRIMEAEFAVVSQVNARLTKKYLQQRMPAVEVEASKPRF